jgi:hypothetical protein
MRRKRHLRLALTMHLRQPALGRPNGHNFNTAYASNFPHSAGGGIWRGVLRIQSPCCENIATVNHSVHWRWLRSDNNLGTTTRTATISDSTRHVTSQCVAQYTPYTAPIARYLQAQLSQLSDPSSREQIGQETCSLRLELPVIFDALVQSACILWGSTA